MRSAKQIDNIIEHEINAHISKESKYYGRLLQWPVMGGKWWAFGIGLSDNYIFDTGEGWVAFKITNHEVEFVARIKFISPDEVIQRLRNAISCFRTWKYSKLGWNSEHLARLVATGDPIAYQIKETPVIGYFSHGGMNLNAKVIFEEYLKQLVSESFVPVVTENLWDSWLIDYQELEFKEGELGKGSYGIVYQGTYRNNPVAIKQLQLTSPSPEAIQEFTNEMKIMFKLRCPQIITLYGVYLTPSYGIVMEFMPHKTLFEIVKNKAHPFGWSIRYPIAVDIAKGVAFLHKAGVLHRDLKSLNVLVNEHWRAKLTDFGISKFKDETKGLSSKKGSLLWIAPERLRGEKYTEQSDIYSLGMTLLELASRELPFKEARGDEEKIRQSIKEGQHDPIPSDCPPKVKNVIQLCWLLDAKKRPTAEQVLKQLEAPDPDLNELGTAKINTGFGL